MTDEAERTPLLEDRVLRILQEKLNLPVVLPETDIVASGLLDSLLFVQLLLHLEREFGVSVGPDELDLENFRSVSAIAQFVATRK